MDAIQSEVKVITRIASYFGISAADFEQIKGMFHKDTGSAYKVLGAQKTDTDDVIKKAYRKMAVKHHPDKYAQMDQAAKQLGSGLNAPYMTLSFMALLVIPELKLSDKGLFDCIKFKFTSLFGR